MKLHQDRVAAVGATAHSVEEVEIGDVYLFIYSESLSLLTA